MTERWGGDAMRDSPHLQNPELGTARGFSEPPGAPARATQWGQASCRSPQPAGKGSPGLLPLFILGGTVQEEKVANSAAGQGQGEGGHRRISKRGGV